MERIAKFNKITFKQFENDLMFSKENANKIYSDIKLPLRATKYSAGYDFFAPYDFSLKPQESILIPTGINVEIKENYFLAIMPRSSFGFKYKLELANTIGIIDADYINSRNEGHILIKLINNNHENKELVVKKGEAFVQGIFINYGITYDDDVNTIRNGGIGSTSKK